MNRIALLVPLAVAIAACGASTEGAESSTPATAPVTVRGETEAPAETTPATEPTTESTTEPADTATTVEVSTTAEAATTLPPPEPTIGAELVGRWAHYDVVAYQDDTIKSLIISYGFNTYSEVDGQIIDATEFCFSESRTDQPIETQLSDAATQAIKPPDTPLEVEMVDGTLRIFRAATPTPVGIRLDDPANESLPTDPDDPRIVDDDGDGNPGITVKIKVSDDLTGELYIARREIFAYDALLTAPDLIEGTVIDNSEQLVIGSSDPIFAGSGDNWGQLQDPDRNPIILRRVEADWDCARLAAERDAIFPPTPSVDW